MEKKEKMLILFEALKGGYRFSNYEKYLKAYQLVFGVKYTGRCNRCASKFLYKNLKAYYDNMIKNNNKF